MSDKYNLDPNAMYIYLRGRLGDPEFKQALVALAFAYRAHAGQSRKDGQPYIVHPLAMACDAIACKGATDNMIATFMLHDVCEDCNVPLSALPVNETVKYGVKLMTIRPFSGEEKAETKKRYFHELLYSLEAVVCKAFDRYMNLIDAVRSHGLSTEAIVKNIRETDELLMPILKEAKRRYPKHSDMLHIIRTSLKNTLVLMSVLYNVKLSNDYSLNPNEMLTYLRGRLDGLGFEQSQVALAFAYEMYVEQFPGDNQSHIARPLAMACDAIACKGATDEIIATILLRGVCKDCNVPLSALPVNETVRKGVELTIVRPFPGEDKVKAERRHFNELLDSREATICEAFGRRMDLIDAVRTHALSEDVMTENIQETHELLMPKLKEAKYLFPELSDMLHTIRTSLKSTLILMSELYQVELS